MIRLEDMVDPAKNSLRLVPGYAAEGGNISIGGQVQAAFWLEHVTALPGDAVMVLISDRRDAPSFALVIGVSSAPDSLSPREGTVAVAPSGSDTVQVNTSRGTVDATFLSSYSPVVSDRVRLLWQAGSPTILGKVGVSPAPVGPDLDPGETPAAPPSRGDAGSEVFAPLDSGTWSTGTRSWNSYLGKDVYQGFYPAQGNNRGAWFYHGKPTKLQSKEVSSLELWLPRRLKVGNWRDRTSVNIYLHGSRQKPGGDVSRGKSHEITVPANWGGGWVQLPASWGADVTTGAGIGLSGGSYAGFAGISGKNKDTRSGQLRVGWKV